MVLPDPDLFPILGYLERHHAVIGDEAASLRREDFVPYPEDWAYRGEWLLYPLVVDKRRTPLKRHCERNRASCPRTTELLLRRPRITMFGFSIASAGAHVLPHGDRPLRNVARAHLGLFDSPGARMRVGDDWLTWTPGKAFVFDGVVEHEVVNEGSGDRLVLLVDFRMTAAERAELRRVASAPSPTWITD